MRQRHLRGGAAFSRAAVRALGLSGLIAVLGAGCGKHDGADTQPQKAPVAELPTVQAPTVVVGEAAVPRFLTLTGSLTAFEDSDVAAGAAGKVLSVHVERGSLVKKGDVLVRLDSRAASASAAEARAQVELARTQKELAEADCARNDKLFEGGSVSAADHQRAQAQCRTAAATAAEARLSLIENNLADTTIRAPFDGLVAERAVAVGTGSGTVLAQLEQAVKELKLPPGYSARPLGQSREIGRTMTNFAIAFALAFVFMYLILAAQFESWLHPLTILLSLPLTVPFALISLLVFRRRPRPSSWAAVTGCAPSS